MGILSRLLGGVPKGEWDGLRLTAAEVWEVDAISDPCLFLRSLPLLVPEPGAVLYLEGAAGGLMREFLRGRESAVRVKIAYGTIWPRPEVHHIPMLTNNLESLAALIAGESRAHPCNHLHVYRDDQMLLQWYDAWFDPILISTAVPEQFVARFAAALARPYSKIRYAS
jgi:hypothetical protein